MEQMGKPVVRKPGLLGFGKNLVAPFFGKPMEVVDRLQLGLKLDEVLNLA
jgi:hypothetical protein